MSDGPNFSPFLAQRRRGAEKKQEEPHNIPMLIRLNMGMGMNLASISPRLCASARK